MMKRPLTSRAITAMLIAGFLASDRVLRDKPDV
jgi:hypothetical protein